MYYSTMWDFLTWCIVSVLRLLVSLASTSPFLGVTCSLTSLPPVSPLLCGLDPPAVVADRLSLQKDLLRGGVV